MTLQDIGTSALNCDSVAQLSVHGPDLIPQCAANSPKAVDKNCLVEVRPAGELQDTPKRDIVRRQMEGDAVELGSGWEGRVGQGGQQSLDTADGQRP